MVLPNGDDQGRNATTNQRKPEISRRGWMKAMIDTGKVLHALEELDDREAETDQRDCRADPRHHRAFDAGARAQPSEMIGRSCPYCEPVRDRTSERRSAPGRR